MKQLLQNRKTLYLVLGIVIASVFTLSVIYAALSTTLNIIGSTEISSASWDIHLENVKVKEGSVEANDPEISGTSSVSFDVDLTLPGDFYEFTVDVVNDGSIDAMIDSVVKTPELTTDQAKYIKYEITYENGESINTKQNLKRETTTPIKVRIEYRKDLSASDLPSATTELSLGLTLIYVQSDGSGTDVKNNGVAGLPKDYVRLNYLQSTGTQYIDTEYVVSSDYSPYKIEVDFSFTEPLTNGFVFGTAKNTGNNHPLLFGVNSNTWMFGHYGHSGSSTKFGSADTNRHTVKYVFGEGIYLDGVLAPATERQASMSSISTKNIGLFARIRGTEPSGHANLKLYSCKFYEENDVLVRDFVPCYRVSDGVKGLYDLVEYKFYTNAGTGEFIGG